MEKIEQYYRLCNYLSENSVLEIFETKICCIFLKNGAVNHIQKVKVGSNFRRKEYGFWIDYHNNTNKIVDIEKWLQSLNCIEGSKKLKNIFIKEDNFWDFNKTFEKVSQIFFRLTNNYGNVCFIDKRATYNEFAKIVVSSKGSFEYRIIKYLLCFFNIRYKNKVENIVINISEDDSNIDIEKELKEKIDRIIYINSLPKLSKENVINILGGKKVTCLVKPAFSGGLVHESIGHDCEGDIFTREELVGKKICKSNISIVDYSKGNGIPNSYYIDGEGNLTYDIKLVDCGVLSEVLSGEDGSEKSYKKVAGGIRSFENQDFPLIRMRNTALLPGEISTEIIIRDFKEGILLEEYTNGDHCINGEFFVEAKYILVVKNNKVIGYLDKVKLKGETYSFLDSITRVGDDFKWTKNMWCNKDGFRVPMSCGAPTIECKLSLILD